MVGAPLVCTVPPSPPEGPALTVDQDRARRSVDAHRAIDGAAPEIARRLAAAHAEATPAAPRDTSRPYTHRGSGGPADPVYQQVVALEAHLRSRGGPLHRCRLLLDNLDGLAGALDAHHRLPAGFLDQVAVLHGTIRRGPVGAPMHTIPTLAGRIGVHLLSLNDAVYAAWRDLWRTGEDRYTTVLDQALLSYSAAGSYARSLAGSLRSYEPASADERPPDERCVECGYRPIKYKRDRRCNTCQRRHYVERERAATRTVRRFAG